MPLHSVHALVIQSEIINEQDKSVLLLTDDARILRSIAPGSARHRNRFGSILELFTEGIFHYYSREERETVTLSRGELKKSYFSTVSRPDSLFYFSLMAEIIGRIIPLHHHDHRLFRLMCALLNAREKEIGAPSLTAYFLVWILRLEGWMIQSRQCSNCNEIKLAEAWLRSDFRGLICSNCRRDEILHFTAPQLLFIEWSERHSPMELPNWEKDNMPGALIPLLIKMIEYHGECRLKCVQILPECR